jgi:TPR repeat protein
MDLNALEFGRLKIEKGQFEEAFEIFYEPARFELDEEALHMLMRMTFNGQLNPEQIQQVYDLQNSELTKDNGCSLYNVGLIYERGLGNVKQDYKVAIEYYEKAIEEDVYDAYCNIGNIYALGLGEEQGVPKDMVKGLELLSKGAEFGSREAAFTVGSLYGMGEFIPKNHSKSVYFLSLAAKLGHDQAKRVLILFGRAHPGKNFDKEIDAATAMYGKIKNMGHLNKLL